MIVKFDQNINDNGMVTITCIPSNWKVFNISPDTYHLFNGDSVVEQIGEWASEVSGENIEYDDFKWDYDHTKIRHTLAEWCMDWLVETLQELGLESLENPQLISSWSPAYYNFTSDGFEMSFDCDPEELRGLTEKFDVDEWAGEHYKSRDGFLSFVPSRLNDPEWRAQYDGEFRIEYLLATEDNEWGELRDKWKYFIWEEVDYIYMENTTTAPEDPAVFNNEDKGDRINEMDQVVSYHEGKGWKDEDSDFFPTILEYHRRESSIVDFRDED